MSLYNMIFGMNPKSDILLAVIGLKNSDVPRFRDVHVNEDGSEITVRTRTGGGNREDYQAENGRLTQAPGYKGDHDDDDDCTYANFEYEVPEMWRSVSGLPT